MDEYIFVNETIDSLSVYNAKNNDMSDNKDNFMVTGILKFVQLKDGSKYDSNKEEERLKDFLIGR